MLFRICEGGRSDFFELIHIFEILYNVQLLLLIGRAEGKARGFLRVGVLRAMVDGSVKS